MTRGPRRRRPGPATRALLWLAGGLVVGAGLALVAAPELLAVELRRVVPFVAVPLVAGIPGLVVLLVVAARRRAADRATRPPLVTTRRRPR